MVPDTPLLIIIVLLAYTYFFVEKVQQIQCNKTSFHIVNSISIRSNSLHISIQRNILFYLKKLTGCMFKLISPSKTVFTPFSALHRRGQGTS